MAILDISCLSFGINKLNFSYLVGIIIYLLVGIMSSGLIDSHGVYGIDAANNTNLPPEEVQLIFLNLERINLQTDLAAQNLKINNTEGAFYHAYIPHSVTYPTIKQVLDKIDASTSTKLEAQLTDLPILINSLSNNTSTFSGVFSSGNIYSNLNQIKVTVQKLTDTLLIDRQDGTRPSNILPVLSNNDVLILQTSALLLDDALQSYIQSNTSNSKLSEYSMTPLAQIDYENSFGLVNSSEKLLSSISDFDSNTISENQLYYKEIKNAIRERQDVNIVSSLIKSVKSNFNSILPTNNLPVNNPNENAVYFNNIHGLLSKTIESISRGDYLQADNHATEAYLDNYEYLEAPIEQFNATLKNDLEIILRENLTKMIDDKNTLSAITLFINNSIIPKLLVAESVLETHTSPVSFTHLNNATVNQLNNKTSFTSSIANIDSLREGFGVYTGERKVMGDVIDSQKQTVRNNVDEIRLGLTQILTLYKDQRYDESINKAREVYLDSYENIEIPLRPINPDFTLDMEIKFAELRNLLQHKDQYKLVEEKVIEIRNGLDESERLVSGTGVIAPAIAFSSSISIIFREGLESALIIGAMLTYLEASRNERFKKHIYLGIIFAIGATAIVWMIADHLIQITGASRELIEGVAGISAVAVLFWVSFWVLNKIETKKWIEFVKSKVWQATTTGSVMVFVMLSFFTIFREGFETVLFYQSMFSYAKYMEAYVITGLVLGLGIVVFIAFIIKRLGKRLPLRVLFGLTMGIGAYMSVAFIGNAVRSFQEADYMHTTPMIGIIPRLDINVASMTGIHPTLESFIAQIVLLGIYVIGSAYVLILLPRKKKKIELARKSMANRYDRNSK